MKVEDFVAISMADGHVEFKYELGTGKVDCAFEIKDLKWFFLWKVDRNVPRVDLNAKYDQYDYEPIRFKNALYCLWIYENKHVHQFCTIFLTRIMMLNFDFYYLVCLFIVLSIVLLEKPPSISTVEIN